MGYIWKGLFVLEIILIAIFASTFIWTEEEMVTVIEDTRIDLKPKLIQNFESIEYVRGAIEPKVKLWRSFLEEEEIGNFKIIKQVGPSCGTTSMKMFADKIGIVKDMEYWDECAKRDNDSGTKPANIAKCFKNMGLKSELLEQKVYELQYGDIVMFYPDMNKSQPETHASVVDYIDKETVRLANPWGYYDEWTIANFSIAFDGWVVRTEGALGTRD